MLSTLFVVALAFTVMHAHAETDPQAALLKLNVETLTQGETGGGNLERPTLIGAWGGTMCCISGYSSCSWIDCSEY